MRVGIYTNRLPYPPIGGIPNYLHNFSQNILGLGIKDVEFLMPNLAEQYDDKLFISYSQKAVEETLAERVLGFSASKSFLHQDIIINLSTWQEKGIYNPQKFHSLYQRQIGDIVRIVNSFDWIILAGSALSLFSTPRLDEWLPYVNVPVMLVVIYPLIEIEFYFGAAVRETVSQQLSKCANHCKFVVVPSEYVHQELIQFCSIKQPIYKIPLGIKIPSVKKSFDKRINSGVVSVSRQGYFSKHKNIDSLLDAWRLVNQPCPDANLTIIGVTAEYAHSLILEPFPQNVTCVPGVHSEKRDLLLQESSIFCLPSSIEAFSFSFAEALSHGLPAIGMRSTAIPEMVKHKETGYLLEHMTDNLYKPNIVELAEAITDLLTDKEKLYRMHRKTFQTIKHLSWHDVVSKYIDLMSFY